MSKVEVSVVRIAGVKTFYIYNHIYDIIGVVGELSVTCLQKFAQVYRLNEVYDK